MKKQILDCNIHPLSDEKVRVKSMGNIFELMYSQHTNTNISIKKISENLYIDLRTGELKECCHIDNRSDNKNSVRVTLGKLRDIINTNVIDVSLCKWITLTYAENMKDTKRLYDDFRKFIMRLKYQYPHFEYIVAMEPQGRGAWHSHLILIFDETAPYIANNVLRDVWGNGFVTVKALDNVTNVGAYLTAYLGDMELSEFSNSGLELRSGQKASLVEVTDEKGFKVKKCIVKGARLCLYPPKFNLYRCSRGIKKPCVEYMRSNEAEKKVGALTPTFERTVALSDDTTGYQNILNYRQFITNTKKLQE